MRMKSVIGWYWVFLTVMLYLGVCGIVYAFRHPEMTDTQRLLHIWDVITWR